MPSLFPLIRAIWRSKIQSILRGGTAPLPPPAVRHPDYPIPLDLDDPMAWDYFWETRIPKQHDLFQLFDLTERLIPLLQERQCHTMLFAGNGISLEPRAFACAGFQAHPPPYGPHAR